MGKHAKHAIHRNSRDALETIQHRLGERCAMIAKIVHESRRMLTDREICHALGFADMNMVRPRITEMIDRGILTEGPTIQDPFSFRNVRTVGLSKMSR